MAQYRADDTSLEARPEGRQGVIGSAGPVLQDAKPIAQLPLPINIRALSPVAASEILVAPGSIFEQQLGVTGP